MENLYHIRITPRSDGSQWLLKLGLTRQQLMERVVDKYDAGDPITFSGRSIAADDIAEIRISTGAKAVDELLAEVEANDRNNGVDVAYEGYKESQVVWLCRDVTDEFIKKPPGWKRGPVGTQRTPRTITVKETIMSTKDVLDELHLEIIEGQKILAIADFNKAALACERWTHGIGSLLRKLNLDEMTIMQWVNLTTAEIASAQRSRSTTSLIPVVNHRLNWLQMHLSDWLLLAPTEASQPGVATDSSKIFVVHGHDGGLKNAVARYLEKLGLVSVVLHERPDRGQTIIEKFEAESKVAFAVVLATGDDIASSTKAVPNALPSAALDAFKRRPRQNVVLELGYFAGHLGRARVAIVTEDDVELPSDLSGILHIKRSEWQVALCAALTDAGFTFGQKHIRDAQAIRE